MEIMAVIGVMGVMRVMAPAHYTTHLMVAGGSGTSWNLTAGMSP